MDVQKALSDDFCRESRRRRLSIPRQKERLECSQFGSSPVLVQSHFLPECATDFQRYLHYLLRPIYLDVEFRG